MSSSQPENPAPQPDTSPGVGEGTTAPEQQTIPTVNPNAPAPAHVKGAAQGSQSVAQPEQSAAVQQAVADAQAANPTMPIEQVLKLPEVQAQIAKAAKEAAEKARQRAIEEMRKQAEREKMDEVERLRLEKEELAAKAKEAEQRAIEATLERDLVSSIVSMGVRPQDENALEFIRYKAFQKVRENDGMPMSVAVKEVVEACPWVLKQEQPAAPAQQPQAQQQAEGTAPPAPQPQYPQTVQPQQVQPTTVPAMQPAATQQPAQQQPPQPVDVLKMSREEYAEYVRRVHNYH